MTVCLFPGQGSQTKGMGEALFQAFPEQVNQADRVLGYSIAALCLEDPQENLNCTLYTQPALYVVEVLAYLDYIAHNPQPNYLAGHSVGEYAALFAAGVFDFETGLKLVKKRGELMDTVLGGAMLAVIGLPEDRIAALLQENDLDTIDIANYNTPQQIVISGRAIDIERANPILSTEARKCMPLKVSGAFHSRYMKEIADQFITYLESMTFSAPQIPVIANVTAKPYPAEAAQQTLGLQLTHSVCWTDSIRYLRSLGETEFVEVGPGRVLINMLKHI